MCSNMPLQCHSYVMFRWSLVGVAAAEPKTPAKSPILVKPRIFSSITPCHSAKKCSRCRFDRLETSNYCLSQIKLAKTIGKHTAFAAFFQQALESIAEVQSYHYSNFWFKSFHSYCINQIAPTYRRNMTFPKMEKKWTMNAIDSAFRGYKSRFKEDHYYAYPNYEIQMANRPKTVPEPVFADLLQYWNSKEAKDKSDANKQNQKMWKYPHIVGRTSFTLIREVEMERVETQESEDGSQSVDAFIIIMGPNHPGRVRLYGRGVTKSLLK
ncbi:hypothetical protein FXO38_20395 [Capsicum annuum]|nr:hypothetical protein FXO37_29719 [Capsicum annuum]KAF3643987.1 hypothetical protein FXO38_20395 [Capsicum annuum]